MIYFNIKTSRGTETVDQLDRANFKTNREYKDEVKRMTNEYHLAGMNVYTSNRSTKEWREE